MTDLTHHSEFILLALVVVWWIVLRITRTHGAVVWSVLQSVGQGAGRSVALRVGGRTALAVITLVGLTITVPARTDPDGWQAPHLFFMPRSSWERDQGEGMLHPAVWYDTQEQGRAAVESDRVAPVPDRESVVAGTSARPEPDALSPLVRLGILPKPPRRDYAHAPAPVVVVAASAVPKPAPAAPMVVAAPTGPAPAGEPLPLGTPANWSPAAFHFTSINLITLSGADHGPPAPATDGNPIALPLAGPQLAALWALLLGLAVPLYRSRRPTPPVPPPRLLTHSLPSL